MSTITIYGWSSFKEWADAGYPGALNTSTMTRNPRQIPVVRCVDCNEEVITGIRCRSCAGRRNSLKYWNEHRKPKTTPLRARYARLEGVSA